MSEGSAADREAKVDLERSIDAVLAASFPASDPPQWDSLATRSRARSHQKNQAPAPASSRASDARSPVP